MQIIFDTNAYRLLSHGKPIEYIRRDFMAITGAEESMGFNVFMAPIPWAELFAHLGDNHDPAFQDCLGAVVGSYIHTRLDYRTGAHRLMHHADMMRAATLFGHTDPTEDKVLLDMNYVAEQIHQKPTEATVVECQSYLLAMQQKLVVHETDFITSFRLLQKTFWSKPKGEQGLGKKTRTTAFFNSWIKGLLEQTASYAGVDLDSILHEDQLRLRRLIKDYFSTPYFLIADILTKMAGDPNFNIENKHRSNWYWDYQMLFFISKMNTFILVTDDGPMIDAARAAGIESRIIRLDEYLSILRLNIAFG